MALPTELCSLPSELRTMILSHLRPREIFCCRRINRQFRALVDDKENKRPLYADGIERMLQHIAAQVDRYCNFSTDSVENEPQTAFFRAGLDYLHFYGVTLEEATKNTHVLTAFVDYYCQRHTEHNPHAHVEPKSAASWLNMLLTWYHACHLCPSTDAALEKAFKKWMLDRTLVASEQAGLLKGDPAKECGKLLKFLEVHPELHRPRPCTLRKLRILDRSRTANPTPSILSEAEGNIFLPKVGLASLSSLSPIRYSVSTRGRRAKWVLEKVKAVGRGEEIGLLEQALILETVHLG